MCRVNAGEGGLKVALVKVDGDSVGGSGWETKATSVEVDGGVAYKMTRREAKTKEQKAVATIALVKVNGGNTEEGGEDSSEDRQR